VFDPGGVGCPGDGFQPGGLIAVHPLLVPPEERQQLSSNSREQLPATSVTPPQPC
jgi:hypothetical protein